MKKNILVFGSIMLLTFTIIAQQKINPAPEELQNLVPSMFNLENLTERWLNVIKVINASMSLGISIELDSNADVVLADGLFAEKVGYCYDTYYSDNEENYERCREQWYLDDDHPEQTPAFHQFMHNIYASEKLRNTTFGWLKPSFIALFSTVEDERKQTLCAIMTHGFSYANTLLQSPQRLACELSYLEHEKTKAQRNEEDTFSYFHWYRPNETCDGPMDWQDDTQPFRKLEAWIIRRQQNQHMGLKEMADWFNKIQYEVLICGA